MGWTWLFAVKCLLLHYLLALALSLPFVLTLTIRFPTLLESRTGAFFIFLLCCFLALLSHCAVDYWLGGF